MAKRFEIYYLIDPFTGIVRYIGFSQDAFRRFQNHLKDMSCSHKVHWIQKVIAEGSFPLLRVVAIVQGRSEAGRVESALILVHRNKGVDLVNGTNGGDGGDTFLFNSNMGEIRYKMKAAAIQLWQDPSHRQRMLEIAHSRVGQIGPNKGRMFDEITRMKVREASIKRFEDPTERAKCGTPGRIVSPETRQKLSDALKGKPGHAWTEKARAALALKVVGANNSFFGKTHSEEARQKMRAAKVGCIPWNKGLKAK